MSLDIRWVHMTLNKIKMEPSHTWAVAAFNDLLQYSNFLMINYIPLQSRCAHCQFNLHLHNEINAGHNFSMTITCNFPQAKPIKSFS